MSRRKKKGVKRKEGTPGPLHGALTNELKHNYPSVPSATLSIISSQVGKSLNQAWRNLSNLTGERKFWGLYAHAVSMLDKMPESAQKAGRSLACGQGCSHCCKSEEINASFFEIKKIAWYLVSQMDESGQVAFQQRLHRAGKTKNISMGVLGAPCAFLEDEACSIHPARPMACRSWHSASAFDCQSRLEGRSTNVMSDPNGKAIEEGFWQTARPAGVLLFELNSVFQYLLSNEKVWSDWADEKITEEDLINAGVPHFTKRLSKSIPSILI